MQLSPRFQRFHRRLLVAKIIAIEIASAVLFFWMLMHVLAKELR
jgi:hypothetical protein